MPKALITGVTGSGGSYLAEYLVENTDCEVYGTSRWHSTTSHKNIANINKLNLIECDLTDFSSTYKMLQKAQPDYIFHLAAHANVHVSFKSPLAVLENNVKGTANLLEAINILGLSSVVQFCSSSETYGNVSPEDIPIKESHPTNPANVYAVSKLTQEKLCLAYWQMYGLPVIVTRMFSYINPRRADLFSTSFAQQAINIERGLQQTIKHGNLNSIRTLIDVRDAMASYWYALHDCNKGEVYNIGGNSVCSVGDFLDKVIAMARVPVKTELDQNLIRPVDVTLQIPDVTKFHNASKWKPRYSLEESVNYLMSVLRER